MHLLIGRCVAYRLRPLVLGERNLFGSPKHAFDMVPDHRWIVSSTPHPPFATAPPAKKYHPSPESHIRLPTSACSAADAIVLLVFQ